MVVAIILACLITMGIVLARMAQDKKMSEVNLLAKCRVMIIDRMESPYDSQQAEKILDEIKTVIPIRVTTLKVNGVRKYFIELNSYMFVMTMPDMGNKKTYSLTDIIPF